MALDASIFQNIKPVEFDTYGDQQKRAATLSQMANQNRRSEQEIAGADREAGMQKLNIIGNALESISGLTPEQRAQAYPQVRNQLVQSGVLKPEEVPPQHDEVLYQTALRQYQHGMEYAKQQHTQAQTGLFGAEAAKNRSEAAKNMHEIAKRAPNAGDMSDPAKLVANLVPKEHQSQAFKEIDAAENTRNMSAAILKSFDDAVAETSGAKGAIGSMVKTPRATLALHQAMQPTFKDLEGTVRQAAMDNTFKNISPSGFDSKEDIARRRASLVDYLQSKSSSPIARAYGIDLSKFPSTASLDSPAPETGPRGLGGMISAVVSPTAAQAAPPPKDRATSQDMEAIHWAQKNKSDPRAQKILAMHGVK